MARTPRQYQHGPAACYHVMNRGHNRKTVFADAEDCRYLLDLLDRYRHRFSFQFYHYCLLATTSICCCSRSRLGGQPCQEELLGGPIPSPGCQAWPEACPDSSLLKSLHPTKPSLGPSFPARQGRRRGEGFTDWFMKCC